MMIRTALSDHTEGAFFLKTEYELTGKGQG